MRVPRERDLKADYGLRLPDTVYENRILEIGEWKWHTLCNTGHQTLTLTFATNGRESIMLVWEKPDGSVYEEEFNTTYRLKQLKDEFPVAVLGCTCLHPDIPTPNDESLKAMVRKFSS